MSANKDGDNSNNHTMHELELQAWLVFIEGKITNDSNDSLDGEVCKNVTWKLQKCCVGGRSW